MASSFFVVYFGFDGLAVQIPNELDVVAVPRSIRRRRSDR